MKKKLLALAAAFCMAFGSFAAEGELVWSDASAEVTKINTAIVNWATNVLTLIAPLVIAGLVFWGVFFVVRLLKRSFNAGRS